MSIRWSDLQPPDNLPRSNSVGLLQVPEMRPRSNSLQLPGPLSSSLNRSRSAIPRSKSSTSLNERSRSPSPDASCRRGSDVTVHHRMKDLCAEGFIRMLTGHNWLSPCELRQVLASRVSYPFCICLVGMNVAPTATANPHNDAKSSTEYQLRTSFFDVTYKQFFGRTWVGSPVPGKAAANQKVRAIYNQNVYFHTGLNDDSVLVIVEVVAISHIGDGKMRQTSCGWGFFRPFKHDGDMPDLTGSTAAPTQRLDLYHGSPRSLLYLDEPLESSSSLSPVTGCQVLYSIQTHRHLARVMHLIPENIFVGANDVLPGLADVPRDGKVQDPLRKPKQAKAMPCYVEKLALSLTPGTEKLEEEMCKQLNEDHINQENKVADGTSVSIMERRLQVGVHNGWCYIDKPEVIHLGGDAAGIKGSSLRRSMRSHQRTPSASSLGSAIGSLIHRNRVQLDGMVEDSNLVVIFLLEYVLGEPVSDNKRPGMAKSSTFTVAVRWAAWNPFLHLDCEDQSIQLHGGPAPIPDSVLVFNGGTDPASGGSVTSVSVPGSCGTINFEFKLQRKLSGGGLQPDMSAPHLHDIPMLNLPISARAPSQGSLTDNGEMQKLHVPGRPPIPARSTGSMRSLLEVPVAPPIRPPAVPPRGAAGLGTSGYQMSLTPHQELPLSQAAPIHHQGPPLSQSAPVGHPRVPRPGHMHPGGSQVYGGDPYGGAQYGAPMGPQGYGQSYGSPYGGVGPFSAAPQYHPSPHGYIPVEITHHRDQMSPMNTARTTGDLQELPFTPVHAPIMATIPGRHAGQGLSRSAYAKLYTAGFPLILDNRGEPPEVVDPSEPVNFNIAREEVDKLQANEIIFQFLAYSRVMTLEESSSGQKPATIFFTFQFYRFPQVTTERLMLGTVEGDLSADPHALPCLLQKLGKDGAVIKGPPGFQVKYHVDPAFLKPGEGRCFIDHMSHQTLFIDVWDGDSLMLIGSCAVDLKHLCRQSREAVQVTYELDVMATEYIESETPVPAGDVTREGVLRPVDVKNILKGRLHLRLANIGHPADSNLTRTDRGSLGIKVKKVISAETGTDSRYGGGSLCTPPTGDHASVLRKTRVAKAAHMTEVDHELASVLYTRKEKLTGTGTGTQNKQTNKAQQRKLARMAAVRQNENETPQVISTYRAEKDERSRDLKTIDLYRTQTKREGILNMLNSAITSEHTIHPSLGTTEFFEFVLRNPYNVQHTIIIDVDDPELRVVTDPRKWRHYKMVNDINTPVEEGMFNMDTESAQPEVFLRPKEYVSIPFTFYTLKANHSVLPQAPSNPFRSAPKTKSTPQHLKRVDPLDSRLIRVFFKTQENKPIAILSLKVDPQPHVVDQTFRFHHPEQSFLKKSVRLPPLHTIPGMPIGGAGVSQVFVRCSDANVITDSRQVQQGEPHDVFIKVACGASPQVKRFFLILYTDPHLSRPLQIWQVYIHALQRVDVAATEGQTSRFTLILRGAQASRLVQCFSSHLDEMQIEPHDPFMLAANALQEVQIGVRPLVAGTKFLYINVVDIEYHQMVRTWLVCINCRAPLITKAYELTLPVGGGKGSNKRIAYTNPYPQWKVFMVRSNRDDLLQFKETRLEVGPGETASLGLRFAPSMAPGSAEILVFINNEEDHNEETFCVRASYQL